MTIPTFPTLSAETEATSGRTNTSAPAMTLAEIGTRSERPQHRSVSSRSNPTLRIILRTIQLLDCDGVALQTSDPAPAGPRGRSVAFTGFLSDTSRLVSAVVRSVRLHAPAGVGAVVVLEGARQVLAARVHLALEVAVHAALGALGRLAEADREASGGLVDRAADAARGQPGDVDLPDDLPVGRDRLDVHDRAEEQAGA